MSSNIVVRKEKRMNNLFGYARSLSEGEYDFTTKEQVGLLEVCEVNNNERLEIKRMTGPIILNLPTASGFRDHQQVFTTTILFTERSTFDLIIRSERALCIRGLSFPTEFRCSGEFALGAGIPKGSFVTIRADMEFNYYVYC